MSEILAAAREVYVAKGLGDLLISDVARKAGVVDGSVYRYFRTKRDLIFNLAEDWMRGLIDSNIKELSGVAGGWSQVRFFVRRHLATYENHPELSRLVFLNLRPDPEYRSSKLFSLVKSYTDVFVNIIQSGIRNGDFRSTVSPGLVRDIVLGSLEHRTWSYLRGEGELDAERLADELVEFLRVGLQIESRPRTLEDAIVRLESIVTQLKA